MRPLAQSHILGSGPKMTHKTSGEAWKVHFQSEKLQVHISAMALRSCVISSMLLLLSDLQKGAHSMAYIWELLGRGVR